VILLLASLVDKKALAFATEFPNPAAVSVVTCRDIAEDSSTFCYPDFLASTITLHGQTISVFSIRGVINLLPAVYPDELVFYPPEEREYQASEFHALLTFFLSALACPVINRPTPSSLTGPYLNPIGWYNMAHQLDIPVSSVSLDSDAFVNPFTPRQSETVVEVSCLGGSVISRSHTIADDYTITLARAAKVEYLKVVYNDGGQEGLQIISAHAVPDIANARTRKALIDFFGRLS